MKELISSRACSLKKLTTADGLNAIQEIPNALFLLDTVIETCGMWQHLRKASRCSHLVPYPGKNNLQRNTNLKTKPKKTNVLHLIRVRKKAEFSSVKKNIAQFVQGKKNCYPNSPEMIPRSQAVGPKATSGNHMA